VLDEREARTKDLLAALDGLETKAAAYSKALAGARLLALRLNEGADLTPTELAVLAPCLEAGLLALDGVHARLTPRGRLLSNEVFYRLLP